MMKKAGYFMMVLCLFPGGGTAFGQSVYKSVDSAGRVTYSSTPPAADAVEVETLILPGGPTQSQVEQAQERVLQVRRGAEEMERQRLDRIEERARQRQAPESAVPEQESAGSQSDGYPWARPVLRPGGYHGERNTSPTGDHPAYKPNRPVPLPRPRVGR